MKKEILERLVNEKLSQRQIGEKVGKCQSVVRYWLKKHNLQTNCGHGPPGRKRSWSDDDMIKALTSSDTIADALRQIGLKVRPGNYDTIHKFLAKHNISLTHMTGKACSKGKGHGSGGIKPKPLSEVLTKNSLYKNQSLKKRLMENGMLKNQCAICDMMPKWKSQPLVLILDHIDGDRYNNLIENLRLVCPNCNSQLPTHCRGKGNNEK